MNSSIKNIALIDCKVIGSKFSGGLVGATVNASINNCYVTGNVTGISDIGGLLGYGYESSLTHCYATGNVTGSDPGNDSDAGGLVGLGQDLSITHCYATGNVTGIRKVGGLVGNTHDSTITNSFATGNVTGIDKVGGFVGEYYGSITCCYATGSVTGDHSVGGLVGRGDSLKFENAYYTDTTGQTEGIGAGVPTSGSANLITVPELDEFIAQGVLPDYRRKSAVSTTDFSLQIGISSNSASQISFSIDPIDISAITGLDLMDTNSIKTIDEFLATINAQ